jgi:hypothetical protein
VPVTLQWARVRGEITHIRDLARYRARDWRPVPICLECGSELVMRLGERLSHHFAHKSAASHCDAARFDAPSTIRVHARCSLFSRLQVGHRLMVQRTCGRKRAGLSLFDAMSNCPERSITELAQGWTHIQAGSSHADATVDLLFCSDDGPLFAWLLPDRELTPDRTAALDAHGCPWLETLVTAETVEALEHWSPPTPMRHHRLGAALQWACDDHRPKP